MRSLILCGGVLLLACDDGGSAVTEPEAGDAATDAASAGDAGPAADAATCDPCPDNETCVEGACECVVGYARVEGSCEDVDECATDNGGCAELCENTPGSHLCLPAGACPEPGVLSKGRLWCY